MSKTYPKKIKLITHKADEFFDKATIDFSTCDKKTVARPLVYCKDIINFTNYIIKERNYDNDIHIKLGIDGGGGFLKFCLSFNKIDNSSCLSEVYKDAGVKKNYNHWNWSGNTRKL